MSKAPTPKEFGTYGTTSTQASKLNSPKPVAKPLTGCGGCKKKYVNDLLKKNKIL